MTVSYANKTFYFDSEQCKQQFEKAPETYVRKEQADRNKGGSSVLSGTTRSWLDMLKPADASHGIKKGLKKSKPKTMGKYPTSPEVVKWKKPEKAGSPPPEWSTGWGGFPGAKDLGIKPKNSDGTNKPKDSRDSDVAPKPISPAKTKFKSQEETLKDLGKLINRPKTSKDKQPESEARQ